MSSVKPGLHYIKKIKLVCIALRKIDLPNFFKKTTISSKNIARENSHVNINQTQQKFIFIT